MPCYTAIYHPAANALAISIHEGATDAVSDNRPENTSPQPNAQGKVDYFAESESDKLSHWKKKLGETVVSLVREDFDRRGIGIWPRYEQALVVDFPKDYKLYVHKSGDRHVPRGDAYLFGSHYVHVFRSPEEFTPHLKWLMRGSPMKDGRRDCHCKYCDPSRTQTEISRELHHKKDGGGGRKGGGKRKDGTRGTKKSQFPSDIPFKDYTKLNTGTAS
ncbi:hypothetical protein BKA93DRAFT_820783 [Sparassis latifolia]|uniref:Cryptic loci regulator 2 N-terminal domain-containing protein n=1 Tax=Sparassis crispa TaxID=139825 RepID=A0A401GG06_9APHY|nr:hypothetical protein SCP_0308240 [Sparassis crispa]GBE81099.1 hypothetical protein SCP_0308240 [Sparassis crispa]